MTSPRVRLILQDNAWGRQDLGLMVWSGYNKIPSLASYFCPECGSIWAWMEDDAGVLKRHQAHHCYCPEHGGGSLILYGDYPLKNFNHTMLLREIDLILAYGDTYDHCNYNDSPAGRRANAEKRKAWLKHNARGGDGDGKDLRLADFL